MNQLKNLIYEFSLVFFECSYNIFNFDMKFIIKDTNNSQSEEEMQENKEDWDDFLRSPQNYPITTQSENNVEAPNQRCNRGFNDEQSFEMGHFKEQVLLSTGDMSQVGDQENASNEDNYPESQIQEEGRGYLQNQFFNDQGYFFENQIYQDPEDEPMDIEPSQTEEIQQKIPQIQPISQEKPLKGLQNFKLVTKSLRQIEKNVNLPKFIGRLFMKYFKMYASEYEQCNEIQRNSLARELSELEDWIKSDKNNTFKLTHLEQYFGGTKYSSRIYRVNRKIMHDILSKHLREQIIHNKQVKDKEVYLISSKVYALRLKHEELAKRMQYK